MEVVPGRWAMEVTFDPESSPGVELLLDAGPYGLGLKAERVAAKVDIALTRVGERKVKARPQCRERIGGVERACSLET